MSNITIVMHYMGLLVMCENILVHFAAEKPDYGGSDLLLSNDFLRECAPSSQFLQGQLTQVHGYLLKSTST